MYRNIWHNVRTADDSTILKKITDLEKKKLFLPKKYSENVLMDFTIEKTRKKNKSKLTCVCLCDMYH